MGGQLGLIAPIVRVLTIAKTERSPFAMVVDAAIVVSRDRLTVNGDRE